jgi:hypothetical protein
MGFIGVFQGIAQITSLRVRKVTATHTRIDRPRHTGNMAQSVTDPQPEKCTPSLMQRQFSRQAPLGIFGIVWQWR